MSKLPPLRADLKLDSTISWLNGQPSYLLIDSLKGNYFRIFPKTLIILQHWEAISIDELLNKLHLLQYSDISKQDIEETLSFLTHHQLIQMQQRESVSILIQQKQKSHLSWFSWLIHYYLFFKIPLIKPDNFLDKTIPWVSKLINKTYFKVMIALIFIDIYLTLQNWQSFFAPLDQLISIQGAINLFIGMSIIKTVHELGHAYASKYFGCSVPSMGLAFIVMFPVLYTDASDSWRLHNPRKRMLIDFAGVISEFHFMAWLILFWHLVDSPIIKNVITYAFAYGFFSTLLINLNPLMRFDGYYAFSNFLGIDNLQQQSFELARWKLRCWLLGSTEPAPIQLSRKKTKIMLIYAFSTWIYRFFLFLGIAVLVYYIFFKLLGILLFLVEIFYFVIAPIVRELISYAKYMKKTPINPNILMTIFGLISIGLILMIPWQTTITVPAVLTFENKEDIYTDLDCYATQVPYRNEQTITQTDVIFQCESPDLVEQKKLIDVKINSMKLKIIQQQGLGQKLGPNQSDQNELDALENQYQNVIDKETRTTIHAPYNGQIVNLLPSTTPLRWYAESSFLMSIVIPSHWIVTAYVSETNMDRMKAIKHPVFLSNIPDTPPIPLTLLIKPLARATQLTNGYLASAYGGDLSIYPPSQQNGAFALKQSFFPFTFTAHPSPPISFEQRGVVIMEVTRQSIIKRFYLLLTSLLIRESTF